ncbi:hypothetical protein [Paracoccus sp. IB05]|uniref:hypothetical protein n=1 Tax=Paracoccus sp. IB05 TaxID=2779367 RepID=UPI0018E7667B|nr:hypothetical protein [Paracoccus sp. IB05]MBJ2152697.1 hypothetical protein [Paracoccus sp. IB05]
MYRNLLPANCHSCGTDVPRAAAHRCPVCLIPFSRMQPGQTQTRMAPEARLLQTRRGDE